MRLIYSKDTSIKCKVARFLKYPKIIPSGQDTGMRYYVGYFYNVNLHALVVDEYVTLFYTKGNSMYLCNDDIQLTSYIVPLYDYKTRKYILLLAGDEYRVPTWDRWRCVKAPNSNLYTISIREDVDWRRGEIIDKRWQIEGVNYNILTLRRLDIYSWHQDKIIFSITTEPDNIPFYRSSLGAYIIGNSFVVSCRMVRDKIYIDVVNLTTEKSDRIIYSVRDYLLGALRNHPSIAPDIVKSYESHIIQDYEKYEAEWEEKDEEQVLAKIDNQLIFFKKVKLYFGIRAFPPIGHITNALVVLLSFYNNTLDVQFLTDKRIILYKNKEMTDKIEIPDNLLLVRKKYSISSLYNVSNSYPYYISEISDNYIFIGGYAYRLSPDNNNYYVQDTSIVKSIRTTRGFNVTLLSDICIAKLEKVHLGLKSNFGIVTVYRKGEDMGPDDEYGYLETLEILDLNKVYQLLKNNKGSELSYVDVSDYVYKIIVQHIMDEAVKMIKDKYYTGYEVRFSVGYYSLSLSEYSATLYITVTVEAWRGVGDRREDRILIIYDVRKRGRSPCKVIFMSSHKDFDELSDISDIRSKALRILTNYEYSKMNFLMLYAHALYNLHPLPSPPLFEYDGEIIIYNDCKNLKVVDIKYNRMSELKYRTNLIGNLDEVNYYIHDDIIVKYRFTFKEDITMYEYYSVLILSELLLTKPIEIITREEYLNLGIL